MAAFSTQDQLNKVSPPYAKARRAGEFLYVSGQLPIDNVTGKMEPGISLQAHQSMKNIMQIIEAEGLTSDNIIKVTIYLTDINHLTQVNEVYKSYFPGQLPARVALQVAALPGGSLIEIDAVAYESVVKNGTPSC